MTCLFIFSYQVIKLVHLANEIKVSTSLINLEILNMFWREMLLKQFGGGQGQWSLFQLYACSLKYILHNVISCQFQNSIKVIKENFIVHLRFKLETLWFREVWQRSRCWSIWGLAPRLCPKPQWSFLRSVSWCFNDFLVIHVRCLIACWTFNITQISQERDKKFLFVILVIISLGLYLQFDLSGVLSQIITLTDVFVHRTKVWGLHISANEKLDHHCTCFIPNHLLCTLIVLEVTVSKINSFIKCTSQIGWKC